MKFEDYLMEKSQEPHSRQGLQKEVSEWGNNLPHLDHCFSKIHSWYTYSSSLSIHKRWYI